MTNRLLEGAMMILMTAALLVIIAFASMGVASLDRKPAAEIYAQGFAAGEESLRQRIKEMNYPNLAACLLEKGKKDVD